MHLHITGDNESSHLTLVNEQVNFPKYKAIPSQKNTVLISSKSYFQRFVDKNLLLNIHQSDYDYLPNTVLVSLLLPTKL